MSKALMLCAAFGWLLALLATWAAIFRGRARDHAEARALRLAELHAQALKRLAVARQTFALLPAVRTLRANCIL